MSVRFIYGRAGSGKSLYCLNDIKKRINEGCMNPLILLVPEQFSLQAERNLIRTVGAGGIIKAEVLSFGRLAYRVFNEVGGITHPHINSASKCMIISKILDSLKDELSFFARAANQQGFVNTISDTITEFKRYNIFPDKLEAAFNSIHDNELLKIKLMELKLIYSQYEEIIKDKYRDTDDDLILLSEKLSGSKQFVDAEIWIDEFSGFTEGEYNVIEKLILISRRVNICLCTDQISDNIKDLSDVFSPIKEGIFKLNKIAEKNKVLIDAPVSLEVSNISRFSGSSELLHLEKNLYSFPYSKYDKRTRDIRIFSAVNIYSEIENTAREIIGLLRDSDYRYRDIAIISGNLNVYEKFIEAVFTSYEIPYFIDKKVEIIKHPIIKLITSMFEILINNWSYEAVFTYLKTGLTGIQGENIDFIENYVLACGIKGGTWTRESAWNFKTRLSFDGFINEGENGILDRLNDIRNNVTRPILRFRDKIKGKKNSRQICEALFEYLMEIGIPERLEAIINRFKVEGRLVLANEYAQVWNIVMEVFNQLAQIDDEEQTSLDRFLKLLKTGFGEYKIGLIPPSLDQVLVGNVERSKNHEVKTIFILGVNDGFFPNSKLTEGILSDRDREGLDKLGIELAKGTRTKAFHEQFLVYSALTIASESLRISYSIADNEGRAMRPSIVISRLKKIFPNILEVSNVTAVNQDISDIDLVTTKLPTFNEMVLNFRNGYEGSKVDDLWWDVYSYYRSKNDFIHKCEIVKASLQYTNQAAPIKKEKVLSLFNNSLYGSVSRFEKYVSCPFSYFVQFGLKAEERRVYKLNPPDTGTFMHKVIEKFSRLISEGENLKWRDITYEECSQLISEIVDEMLLTVQGSIMNSSKRYVNLSKRLKRVLTRSAWVITEHIKRSSFEPCDYEVGFGENEKYPPITIELSTGEKISLVGRIDRIDSFENEDTKYLRIIDYKSGTKAFKLSQVYYGLQIQLLTYLDAIWDNSGNDAEKAFLPGGLLYFKLDDPMIKAPDSLSEEEIEKQIIKQLKMKGLVLADVKLIREMDNQIDGSSDIIPARINKGDVLGRTSGATIEQFQLLRKYVKNTLKAIGEEILKGEIAVRPVKNKKDTPCIYCQYGAVCQFDTSFKDNGYKVLNDISDDEVWKLIKNNSGNKLNNMDSSEININSNKEEV